MFLGLDRRKRLHSLHPSCVPELQGEPPAIGVHVHAENDGCTLFTRAFAEAVPKRAARLIRKLAAPLQEASSAERDDLEH